VAHPAQEPRKVRRPPPPTDSTQTVQLGSGVPAGLLALAGLHDGGHLELVALGDGPAQGEQEPLAGQGRHGRRPGLLSGLGGLLAGFRQVHVFQGPAAIRAAGQGSEEGRVVARTPASTVGSALQVGLGGGVAAPELLELLEVQAAQEVLAGAGWARGWVQASWRARVAMRR
jgi:hypothetical protein